jgi:hypothetical protein
VRVFFFLVPSFLLPFPPEKLLLLLLFSRCPPVRMKPEEEEEEEEEREVSSVVLKEERKASGKAGSSSSNKLPNISPCFCFCFSFWSLCTVLPPSKNREFWLIGGHWAELSCSLDSWSSLGTQIFLSSA